MNPTGQSRFNQARIEWAIRLRYSPMPKLDMEWLSAQLNAFRIGELRVVGKTWEIMMERDGELAVNADKRYSDLAGLPYKIVSDGSPDGDRHAVALTYFYKHLRATHALDQDKVGGVSELLYQMAGAHSYYYSIHEMLLRVDNPAAREVTAEFRHTPIWFFEARRGYLGYLPHIFDMYGEPCIQGEWLTCVGLGWMRALSVAYCMKMFSLRDWQIWCSRYGSGFLVGKTEAAKDSPEWAEASEAMRILSNDGAVLTHPKVAFEFLEQASRSGMPFKELVELVNSLYAKCYRGVDLATGSRVANNGAREAGGAQNPVGASVQKEESGIFLSRDAAWATGCLNERVDRPVIRFLFDEEPRAAAAIMPPLEDNADEDLKTLQALVPMGLRIALKDIYEKFRWKAPAPGEPCLEPPAQSAPPDGARSTPKTADISATTQPAKEEQQSPIGAGANPGAIQSAVHELPDPQVEAASFWSAAAAALRARRAVSKDNTPQVPALAIAVPNDSPARQPAGEGARQ